jgi:hypothetical protein
MKSQQHQSRQFPCGHEAKKDGQLIRDNEDDQDDGDRRTDNRPINKTAEMWKALQKKT